MASARRTASGLFVSGPRGGFLFGGGHFLDGYEGLDEGSGKLIKLQQSLGEDIRVEI